ncbi:MAG: hypothetical protein JXB85_11895 [Anaerolineales bacterium]|nr:hypothetical protein [Anaerolineales bacterium]
MARNRSVTLGVIVLFLVALMGCNTPSSNIVVGCDAADLIDAIRLANSNPNRTTLTLDPGCIYTLTVVDNEIGYGYLSPGESQGNGLPAITTEIVIVGDLDDPPVIRRSSAAGTPEFRFFFITAAGRLTLQALLLENGLNAWAGGAIAIEHGTLTTESVGFYDNASPGGAPFANTTGGGGGGAIANLGGTLELHNTVFAGNSALSGGALDNRGGGTILIDEFSLLIGNSAHSGGALVNMDGAVTFIGGHINDNIATQSGGAIFNRGTLVLEQTLLQGNSQTGSGGGGGALANFTDSPGFYPAQVTATDCIFYANAGARGGAVDNVGGMITITGGSLQDNTAEQWGGGVFNASYGATDATLTVVASLVEGNQAQVGGGVFNAGLMTVTHATFTGNAADEHGGAINNAYYDGNYGSLLVVGSTLSANTASGGAALANDGSLMVLNSTISGNTAGTGTGLLNDGDALIDFSTIAFNTGYHGVAIYANTGTVSVEHSVIGPNQPYNCMVNQGTITAQDANLSSDDTCPGFSLVEDPLLALLADNGGLTRTHALGAGSPAIDAALDCFDTWGDLLPLDQRGAARPQPVGGSCDLGAFEFDPLSPPPPQQPAALLLRADTPVNCRAGSSTLFSPLAFLSPGQEVPLVGVNPSGTWFLVHPLDPGLDCWVWSEAVTPLVDLSLVPVVEDPPLPYIPPDETVEPVPQQGCWVGSLTAAGQVCVVPCPAGAWPGGACSP